jgi:hypothetical protein
MRTNGILPLVSESKILTKRSLVNGKFSPIINIYNLNFTVGFELKRVSQPMIKSWLIFSKYGQE